SKDEDGVIQQVHWDFGDGQQAEGWFVEHSFTEPGQYLVRLTVEDDDTGLTCSRAQVELPVVVLAQPALQIQGPEQVCVNQEVRYSLNGEAEQVHWDFGKGLKGQGREVSVTFPQAGMREIHTVVDGQPGPAETVQVLSLPELVLPEQLTVLAGEEVRIAPLAVQETDIRPLFQWESGDGGDGTVSEESLFQHVYSEPGKYTVRLLMNGGAEMPACLAAEKEIPVTVLPLPAVNILSEPEQVFSGGARDEVLFRAELRNSQGNWTYHWDFGDKSRAEGAMVSHIYKKLGTYTVTLTLIDGNGIARKPYSFSREIKVQGHGKE
ncbi:MAG: PKD domain-containing protein, partial [Candidatus Electrothrix sp. AUS1_2]|nr:PKD domain-containing protein [Candidatus Electrothrix sp. AUS1_2]